MLKKVESFMKLICRGRLVRMGVDNADDAAHGAGSGCSLPEQACVSEVKNRRYDTRESVTGIKFRNSLLVSAGYVVSAV